MEPLFTAHGEDVFLDIYQEKIVIRRWNTWNTILIHWLKGAKEIQISQISSIQYKPAGRFTFGYIQFAFLGGTENKTGIMWAMEDENSCLFRIKQQAEFDQAKDMIEDLANQAKIASNASEDSYSVADEIEKFFVLKEKWAITEEEFQAKKKELLWL